MAQSTNIIDRYENAKASGKRICGLMGVPVRIEDVSDAIALDDVEGHVEYDEVTFAYETGGGATVPVPVDGSVVENIRYGRFDADRIVVLDEGRVVERGTHEGLLAADGLYANLWGVQPGEIESLPEVSGTHCGAVRGPQGLISAGLKTGTTMFF